MNSKTAHFFLMTKVWEKKLAALFLERDIGLLTSSPKLKDDSSQQTRNAILGKKSLNKHELCSLHAVKKPVMPFARFSAENCRSASGFMLGILEMGKYPVLPQVKLRAFPVPICLGFSLLAWYAMPGMPGSLLLHCKVQAWGEVVPPVCQCLASLVQGDCPEFYECPMSTES